MNKKDIIKNINFLNSQNYIIGDNEKLNIILYLGNKENYILGLDDIKMNGTIHKEKIKSVKNTVLSRIYLNFNFLIIASLVLFIILYILGFGLMVSTIISLFFVIYPIFILYDLNRLYKKSRILKNNNKYYYYKMKK